jgi:hypothetical protein
LDGSDHDNLVVNQCEGIALIFSVEDCRLRLETITGLGASYIGLVPGRSIARLPNDQVRYGPKRAFNHYWGLFSEDAQSGAPTKQ